MASITDHVIKLQELTQQNLDILQALNESFFTNQNHLTVRVGENNYAIPSFITLENKLNTLTANFNNLVHAPETGEAFFNFDGNSRAIEVRSYSSVPESLELKPVEQFNWEQNDIFKDFLTPNPYIKLDVQSLPNDITQVLVKKIIPISTELKAVFEGKLKSGQDDIVSTTFAYKDLYKILYPYKPDVDYIEYDTRMNLPVRKNIGSGTYVIEEIVDDVVDDNLDNYITIKLRRDLDPTLYMSSLKYRLFDETIERPLKVGDQLVTFEGNAKMEITELRSNTNTIVVKVLHGEFLNLVPSNNSQTIVDLNKLKFYSPIDFDSDKYIHIPLEEDKYVFVAIAALNPRMNVQSPWGLGILLNTDKLTLEGDDSKKDFRSFYNETVRNIGDVLFEITSMMSNTLTKYPHSEYEELVGFSPIVDTNNILVTQINKHLNDSESVKNIRSAYSQKKNLQSQLTEVQNEIVALNKTLASVSFDDTTGRRTAYIAQINSLNARKNEISTAIIKIVDEIAVAANSSEVPIENAKYRIRGFFDINQVDKRLSDGTNLRDHIKGIRVQYRYKNVDALQNQALTIDNKFLFSDWNDMGGFDREMVPEYKSGKYQSDLTKVNDTVNSPSFNQIDIPISQGETVDIKLKLIYDFGYPFVQVSSLWSPIVNISFPDEFLHDTKILDIISENNNDIETNRFKNIIKEEGVPEHINDKITDQDMTYYHKPENIASGFYTAERRIIPLKDKLEDLSNILTQLKDEIYGTNVDSLKVAIKQGGNVVNLLPFANNSIYTESYSNIKNSNGTDKYVGRYAYDETTHLITTVFNISLYNDSEHIVKLYSMFPGNRDNQLYDITNYKFTKDDYCNAQDKGVWFEYPDTNTNGMKIQGGNQFMYFRIKDAYTGASFYDTGNQSGVNDKLSLDQDKVKCTETAISSNLMYVYPKLSNQYGLCLDSNQVGGYLTIKPKEEILIPLVVEFYLTEDESIYKTLSFDILPSLYKDPVNYKFTITAKYKNAIQDDIVSSQSSSSKYDAYNTIYVGR